MPKGGLSLDWVPMDNQITKSRLLVPADQELRMKIRMKSREVVFRHKIQPPARLELIEALAREVLAGLNIEADYLAFAMVNCGNEIWRSVVEAVPFERRLLLLPQCLRNSNSCKGSFDEFGLLCAGCGQCNVDALLEMAGSMGYTTLVAEGTTMAVSLVEEGAVDAVIGVSCMETLEKSFNPVSVSGIPVMGIPLLFNGCADTQVDLKWLKQVISSHHCGSSLQPVSLAGVKDRIERLFTNERVAHFFEKNNDTSCLAVEALLEGGQRIRPLLALLAYYSYSTDAEDSVADTLALAIECFHKASLAHDDIEDSDDFRYQKQTLHKREGVAVAINIGDLLVGKGYQLLSGLSVDPGRLSQIFQMVTAAHVDSSIGQGSDLLQTRDTTILSVEEQLDVFRLKTGSAIRASLLPGAIAGGANAEELERVAIFADSFGIAYQIRDDLQEYQQQKEGELCTADFPFLLSLLNEQVSGFTNDNLAELMICYKIEEIAEDYLTRNIQKTYRSVETIASLKLRLGLHIVMGNFFKK